MKVVKNFRKDASWREKLFGHFLLIAGDIRITPRRNLLLKKEYSQLKRQLGKGDILFAGSKREISRFFLRGDLSHSLIYLGKGKFIHSAAEFGVSEISLRELFEKYDYLEGYRHLKFTDQYRKKVLDFVINAKGKAYDFRFLHNNVDEFYCTKLVGQAYEKAGLKMEIRRESLLLPYLSTTHPMDLVMNDFNVVFASQSLLNLRKKRAKKWIVRMKLRVQKMFVSWEKV